MSGVTVLALILGALVLVVLYQAVRLAWMVYDDSPRAIQRRWDRYNAAKPRVCPCGARGTVLRQSGPCQWWYCAAHRVMPLDVPYSDRGMPDGRRHCLNGCGWHQDVGDDGRVWGSGGPIAASDCDHRFGPVEMFALPEGSR